MELNNIFYTDCLEYLKGLPDESIDLIFTSPPYANKRKNCYDTLGIENYNDWFIRIAYELKRILKPTGSFFLNIKPCVNRGERSLYVFELVIRLKREVGFMFLEEYCWVKNPFPDKMKNRLKNSFEPLYHFTKSEDITFNPYSCATEIQAGSLARAKRKVCGAPETIVV